jgi:hypothetical protein
MIPAYGILRFRSQAFALLPALILAGCASASVKHSDGRSASAQDADNGGDGEPKPYSEVITDKAVTDRGLFDVHDVGDKLYFEVPDSLLGRDMLLVSRIARVPYGLAGGFMAAGHKVSEQVVRWERVENRVLLRKVSYENVADDSLPVHISVVNNNFAPILASFDVAAEGPPPQSGDEADSADGGASADVSPGRTAVIEVTAFYQEDVPAISGLAGSIREAYKVRELDGDRSFINYAHAFPLNVDVRHTLTFEAEAPPTNAGTQTLSLEMHQSMVLLPAEPMRPRFADPRLGWFTVTQVNYGLDRQKAAEQTFLSRWRLEPSDAEAYARGELVEPVKPITYYLDPATPAKWRPYVRQGIEDWQVAFETAGFRNAIVALDPPTAEEDPNWNGEDVRYSMVRWAATEVRNAMGPSVSDPRSGEIIESDIVWYHNHMRSYRNRLMLETGAANPLARSLPIDEGLMGEAMRQVIAHEIGHAIGLPHNMISSSAYPVDSLRNASFAARMGVAPTIMDYARQNYIAQPGDGLQGAAFIRQIGPYDHYAINWGYRALPEAATPEDEKPTLDGWILERADDPMYRYAPQRGGLPVDPRTQTEDMGDDPVRASGFGIANLKVVAPHLIEWTSTPGEDYADLAELYGELLGQFSRYVGHVVTLVGGVYETLKASDQEGVVYEPVPALKQQEAMEFISSELFETPSWLVDPQILRRIEHAGAVDRVRALQTRVLNWLLDPERMQRIIETEALEDGESHTLVEFMDAVEGSIWAELQSSSTIDTYRRNLQRAHLERLEWLMTEDLPSPPANDFLWSTPVNVSQSDIRALVRAQLTGLREKARRAATRTEDHMTQWHLEDVVQRIDGILERVRLGN